MRIDETSISGLVQSAATLSSQQATIAQQLSSGARLTALSDDPDAAAQGEQLAAQIAQSASFQQSATSAGSRLQASDQALGEVVTQLTSAVSLAVQGQNDTENPTGRASLAEQLSGIRSTVLSLANSSYGGTYLFAGSQGATAPFALASDGSVSYAGDSATSALAVSSGSSVATSVSGQDVFLQPDTDVFAALQQVIAGLQSGSAPGADAVTQLRSSLDTVLTRRATLDSNSSRLQGAESYAATQQTQLEATESKLLAADPVSLATQLSAYETQRTALLSTIAAVQKGSLFDYL